MLRAEMLSNNINIFWGYKGVAFLLEYHVIIHTRDDFFLGFTGE